MATSSDRANPSLHDIDLDLFLLRHVDNNRHKRLTAFTHMVTPQVFAPEFTNLLNMQF